IAHKLLAMNGSAWSTDSSAGIVYYDDPEQPASAGPLGYGPPLTIAGTGTSAGAAVVAVGFALKTVIFDVSSTPAQRVTELACGAGALALSADARLPAATPAGGASQYLHDCTLTVRSLPDGTLVHSWPSTADSSPTNEFLTGFSMSRSG